MREVIEYRREDREFNVEETSENSYLGSVIKNTTLLNDIKDNELVIDSNVLKIKQFDGLKELVLENNIIKIKE